MKRIAVAALAVLLGAGSVGATCVGDPGWAGCTPGNTGACGITSSATAAFLSVPDPNDGTSPGIKIWTPSAINVTDRDETGMNSSTEYCFGPGYNKTGQLHMILGEVRSSSTNGTQPPTAGWQNSLVTWGTGPSQVAVFAEGYNIWCEAHYNVTGGVGDAMYALYGQLDVYNTSGVFQYTTPIGWGTAWIPSGENGQVSVSGSGAQGLALPVGWQVNFAVYTYGSASGAYINYGQMTRHCTMTPAN